MSVELTVLVHDPTPVVVTFSSRAHRRTQTASMSFRDAGCRPQTASMSFMDAGCRLQNGVHELSMDAG